MKCPAALCGYPDGPCVVDVEFTGCFDAEDFYETRLCTGSAAGTETRSSAPERCGHPGIGG